MIRPDELIIDNFAGAGGASLGIERALGRPIDIAINHDHLALQVHQLNHPHTRHITDNIWSVNPRELVGGRPVGLAWFSPDCRHFSKAKGGQPVSKSVRGLAWVVIRWAVSAKPRIIVLENVEEFRDWCPLVDGKPCPERKGQTFRLWLRRLEQAGYRVEFRELRGCDYGSPTTRKRLFMIARRDGRPIVWPAPTHGPGTGQPYKTAAEIIDWSLPCHSIFLTKEEGKKVGVRRPLVDATMRRIAKGVVRYVLEAEKPFLVHLTHAGERRCHGVDEPVPTVTRANRGEMALVSPTLIQTGYGERPGQEPRVPGLEKPLGTVVAGGAKHAVVAAFISRYFGQGVGRGIDEPLPTVTANGQGKSALIAACMAQHNTGMVGHPIDRPVSTIIGKGSTQALIAASMINMKGLDRRDSECNKPIQTICAGGGHVGLIASFLTKYYGTAGGLPLDLPLHTVTVKDRFNLITVKIGGTTYVITDIGMRMLAPHELARAQGFDDGYLFARIDGKNITKTDKVRLIGNTVNPQVAEAIVNANFNDPAEERIAA